MTQNLLLILQRRAEARAILFSAGEFDLYEALEPLFAFANTSGILDEIDAEAALGIIRDAFKGRSSRMKRRKSLKGRHLRRFTPQEDAVLRAEFSAYVPLEEIATSSWTVIGARSGSAVSGLG